MKVCWFRLDTLFSRQQQQKPEQEQQMEDDSVTEQEEEDEEGEEEETSDDLQSLDSGRLHRGQNKTKLRNGVRQKSEEEADGEMEENESDNDDDNDDGDEGKRGFHSHSYYSPSPSSRVGVDAAAAEDACAKHLESTSLRRRLDTNVKSLTQVDDNNTHSLSSVDENNYYVRVLRSGKKSGVSVSKRKTSGCKNNLIINNKSKGIRGSVDSKSKYTRNREEEEDKEYQDKNKEKETRKMGAIKCSSNCDKDGKGMSLKFKNQMNSFSNCHSNNRNSRDNIDSLSTCSKCVLVCGDSNHNNSEDSFSRTGEKSKVYSYADAPFYLKFNPHITGGYRSALTPWECVKSLFFWNNETLNIWSHLLGWLFFLGLSVYDAFGLLNLPTTHPWDQVIITMMLVSFQACMLLSALYHVFCCCSEQFYRRWLSADLFGVSLSLLAIYISGIYYAFSCVPFWLNFYLITVAAIFLSAMVMQIIPIVKKPTTEEAFHWRLVVFGGWAAYGIVPTVHWAILHGGMSSPIVALMLPRIGWMYGISIAAFFFYVFRVPEKLWSGYFNYIGSSHQLWHILIVAALYWWHNTGMVYLHYRAKAENSCENEYAFLFPPTESPPPVEA